MMKKLFISLSIISLLLSCQSNKDSSVQEFVEVNGEKIPVIHVDLVEDSSTTIGWSAIFEDVDIIPLETSEKCLIQNWQTSLSPTSIYLATQTGSLGPVRLMEFDFSGKYLRDFGGGGKGPGEHTGYMLMGVRYYPEFNSVLAEFNGIPFENHLFTTTGEFIDNITNPFELGGSIARLDDDLYITLGSSTGRPNYYRDSVLLEWHDAEGETIKSVKRTEYPPENSTGFTPYGSNSSVYKYGDAWHLLSPGNDTIYEIKGLEIRPVGLFVFSENYMQINKIIDPKEAIGHFSVKVFAENDQYWILQKRLATVCDAQEYNPGQWGCMWDFNYSYIFIDKKSGKSRNLTFEDDLLGIIPWQSMKYSFQWDDSGRFYIVVGAMHLVEQIDKALENGTLPESAIQKIKKLRQSIDEDSNPVLFMFKERDKFNL